MNDLEKECPMLHTFFCKGGQIIYEQEGRIKIMLPIEWEHTPQTCEKIKTLFSEFIQRGGNIASCKVLEAAEQLEITYRKAVELVAHFYLGGIKKSGVFHIYPPSIIEYLQELTRSMRKRCWYDTKLNG